MTNESATGHALPEVVGHCLADLANVSTPARFCELLQPAILEANFGTAFGNEVRSPDIKSPLHGVKVAALLLNEAFDVLFGEGGDQNTAGATIAASFLESALGPADNAISGQLPLLAAHRGWLLDLIAATETAEDSAEAFSPKRKRGRPRGAGGNVFFNNFVKRLFEVAGLCGGRWTHYRDQNSIDELRWKGTLLPALEMLRPFLPAKGFFPSANLGRCVEHAIESLKGPNHK
jgi:hypothetical protein